MTADKAIAAFATSALTLLAMFFGWGSDVVATWSGIIAALAAAVAPLLVYVIPNRAKV
jgi:hypothetical protein